VPQILVLEVVAADLDRPPPLLGVYGDRRLAGSKRRPGGLVDMPKLRITIGMLLTSRVFWLACNRNPNPRNSFAADRSDT
jgi:hypothetical protein